MFFKSITEFLANRTSYMLGAFNGIQKDTSIYANCRLPGKKIYRFFRIKVFIFHSRNVHAVSIISLIFQLMHILYTL